MYGKIYTHREKLSNTTSSRRHCFGSCRTEYVGNGNQIFWILSKIYYLYKHFELKVILLTKYQFEDKTSLAQNWAALFVCWCYWWRVRPHSAYADPFWLICGGSICIKKFFSIQDGITLSRKWVSGHQSVLHIKVSLLQRENIKKLKNCSVYGCYFRQ